MILEIGKNLKSILKHMAKTCPEEISNTCINLSWIADTLDNFLKDENIEGLHWELTKEGEDYYFDLRKIRRNNEKK